MIKKNLLSNLSITEEDIIYDDRKEIGACLYNVKRAYTQSFKENETHRLCIPDDWILCNDFENICSQIINNFPDKVIGLWSYPLNTYFDKIMKYTKGDLSKLSSPYIKVNNVTGIGMIIPKEYINDLFLWLEKKYGKNYLNEQVDDDVIPKYFIEKKIDIISTIPCLIQHIGDESVLYKNAHIRRTAFFKKDVSNINWNNKLIMTTNNLNKLI